MSVLNFSLKMAMTKSTGFFLVAILGLSVACVGLLVALLTKSPAQIEENNKTQDFGAPIIAEATDDDFEPYEEPGEDPDWIDQAENEEDESILTNFPWENNVRLPKNVLPLHYDLYLFPDLQDGMFSGKVDIEIDSLEERDYFLAHVKYLEILDAKLTRNGADIDLMEAMEYEPNEFFVMRTSQMAPPGKYIMHFGKKKSNFERAIPFNSFHLQNLEAISQKASLDSTKVSTRMERVKKFQLLPPNFNPLMLGERFPVLMSQVSSRDSQ